MPASRVQLLLADNSQAHLTRMVSVSPDGVHTGCGVDSPDRCPAARRAQIQRFDDSDGIDACPKLRAAHADPVAALCVPVSIMGRTVGVMHATGPVNQRFPDDDETRLAVLAKLGGARLGLVRVMAETELQATTDPLTGLLNRRSFEQHFTAARHGAETVLVAMADLDGFKALNDTFGHETGDRALRLFARVLSESIRARDLIGRHGGEEFIVCLPACPLRKGAEILDTLRERLAAAVTVAGLPTFTVSFGVVESSAGEELPDLRARADAALFAAKRAGRDRVVAHDSDGAVVEADGHGVEPRLPGREPLAGRP
jgi:diguanylate cyclase (GGDEF)-like protein